MTTAILLSIAVVASVALTIWLVQRAVAIAEGRCTGCCTAESDSGQVGQCPSHGMGN
jgi:hypothetical protein